MDPRALFSSLPISLRAALLMMLAMTFFASMSVFIRMSAKELDPLEVVFFRNFLALLFMLPWIARRGVGVMRTKRIGLYSIRALINIFGMAAGFTALTMIPLAEATALSFTTPLFVTIGAVLVFGEAIRARRISALLIGFAGTLIVLRPGVEAISLGALLTIGNAVVIAVTTLIVKTLTKTESPATIVAYMALLQSPLALIPALFVWQWPTAETYVWLTLLAGAGTLGHICWTRACSMVELTQLQPLDFIRLPLVALAAFIMFAETPTIWTWIGGAVIFSSTAYITHREAMIARRKQS
ncbi:MAG: DMT family transporter [Rhodospirillaceae bacterium]|nr:DMT family transporter [Rhodospirillaceae bacterium]